MYRKKNALKIFSLLLLLLPVVGLAQTEFDVQVLSSYESLFQRQDGWTGADGVYSVALSDKKILWLFGDTWIGKIRDGRHINAVIINNSIALQFGKDPAGAQIDFFYGRTLDGNPAAFIRPADGRGWFWFYSGVMTSHGLYLFLIQIEHSGEASAFGFKPVGSWLAKVINPEDPPDRWRITQYRIPYGYFSAAGDTVWGSALLEVGAQLYIFGTNEEIKAGFHEKFMILARVPEAMLTDFEQWRFFGSGQWHADVSKAGRLCSNMANEYSVSFQSFIGNYVVVYTEGGVSQKIVARFAPEPQGPWSDPTALYRCPEANWGENIFCYAAKAHPAISTAGNELIISYVANASDFAKIEADARLYHPRFLRVTFHAADLE